RETFWRWIEPQIRGRASAACGPVDCKGGREPLHQRRVARYDVDGVHAFELSEMREQTCVGIDRQRERIHGRRQRRSVVQLIQRDRPWNFRIGERERLEIVAQQRADDDAYAACTRLLERGEDAIFLMRDDDDLRLLAGLFGGREKSRAHRFRSACVSGNFEWQDERNDIARGGGRLPDPRRFRRRRLGRRFGFDRRLRRQRKYRNLRRGRLRCRRWRRRGERRLP